MRTFNGLPGEFRASLRGALLDLARAVARPDDRGGKSTKTIRGTEDVFHRLRVGEYRVMYDVFTEDEVVLVLGIVHRRDLERWLRNR